MSTSYTKLHEPAHLANGWKADVDDWRNPRSLVAQHPSHGSVALPYEPDADAMIALLAQVPGMKLGDARQLAVQVRVKLAARHLRVAPS
jgi:hypothetical protein